MKSERRSREPFFGELLPKHSHDATPKRRLPTPSFCRLKLEHLEDRLPPGDALFGIWTAFALILSDQMSPDPDNLPLDDRTQWSAGPQSAPTHIIASHDSVMVQSPFRRAAESADLAAVDSPGRSESAGLIGDMGAPPVPNAIGVSHSLAAGAALAKTLNTGPLAAGAIPVRANRSAEQTPVAKASDIQPTRSGPLSLSLRPGAIPVNDVKAVAGAVPSAQRLQPHIVTFHSHASPDAPDASSSSSFGPCPDNMPNCFDAVTIVAQHGTPSSGVDAFPIMVGAAISPAGTRAFVATYDASLSSTQVAFISFNNAIITRANGVAADISGNIYLTGVTDALNPGGDLSGFAVKMTPDMSTVLWADAFSSDPTIGGNAFGYGITVKGNGANVWLTGSLVQNGRDPGRAMLVANLDGITGVPISLATYRFGFTSQPGDTEGFGIAVNAFGEVYIAGYFFDASSFASNQVLCVKLAADLSLDLAVSFPNVGDNRGTGIALDFSGNVYMTGFLHRFGSSDPSHRDLLYVQFNSDLSKSDLHTISADPINLFGNDIAVNLAGGAIQPIIAGGYDDGVSPKALLIRLSPPGILDQITFGGSNTEVANGLSFRTGGSVYVIGTTTSPDFPTTPGAARRTYSGGASDGFVSAFTLS